MVDINKSWQRFKLGLGLFVVSAFCLLLFSRLHPAIYFISLGTLFVGFAIAMLGYWGIFLQRFARFKNKKPPPRF
jgi:hypothetical protein